MPGSFFLRVAVSAPATISPTFNPETFFRHHLVHDFVHDGPPTDPASLQKKREGQDEKLMEWSFPLPPPSFPPSSFPA